MRYRKRSDKNLITIPGIGAITDDRIIEGEQYARFCPFLLEEVAEDEVAPPKKKVEAPPVRKPVAVAAPIPVEDEDEDEDNEEDRVYTESELKAMNKQDLIALGKDDFGILLEMTMLKADMVYKILEAQEDEE